MPASDPLVMCVFFPWTLFVSRQFQASTTNILDMKMSWEEEKRRKKKKLT